ncbi:hypothetical protein K470DRAFT_147349 [Piedraia hortae CBS 480.64]|uniref:Uncharacterized protein n=1 Tax=Piedraia hortae CBS 480.64 TaxID=1314780 RepID=A0A6A7BU72_9PEZI|nr:hypothetical protein K470DRAFT_147349 [Piedraia hortae CBS 480.64]
MRHQLLGNKPHDSSNDIAVSASSSLFPRRKSDGAANSVLNSFQHQPESVHPGFHDILCVNSCACVWTAGGILAFFPFLVHPGHLLCLNLCWAVPVAGLRSVSACSPFHPRLQCHATTSGSSTISGHLNEQVMTSSTQPRGLSITYKALTRELDE